MLTWDTRSVVCSSEKDYAKLTTVPFERLALPLCGGHWYGTYETGVAGLGKWSWS